MIKYEDGFVKVQPVVAVIVGLITIASLVLSPFVVNTNIKVERLETRVIELEKKQIENEMKMSAFEKQVVPYDKALDDIRTMRDDIIKIKMALNIKD